MALYNGHGIPLGIGDSAAHGSYYYYPVGETEKKDWANYKAQELIDHVYEPLRLANPNYITRSVIGRDATDTYDIWQYTFCPDYPEQTIYLQAGVHGRESEAWIGLARIMQIICNEWQTHPGFEYIRWNCKIVCVPVVNPWGVANKSDKNVNGINLNRDLVDVSQTETSVVKGFIDSVKAADGINFALDFHTTINDSYGDYMLTVWTGEANEFVAKRVVYMLARKNAPERIPGYLSKYDLGEHDLRLPKVGDSVNSGTYVGYFKEIGIPGLTVEHSDYVWDTTWHTAVTVSKCIEHFANHLIHHAFAKFGVE